jgi:hypothetical protein
MLETRVTQITDRTPSGEGAVMTTTNRRNFLAATGAVAGSIVLPGTAHAARRSPDSARESVVAFVADHRSAELRLLVGEREVVVNDPDLVARILNAAGGE